jgi:RNA-directed DNA polymerase
MGSCATTEGSPQGGAISPMLANIFLHHVLDEWFESEVRPRLSGNSALVRFADDAVMAFAYFRDAKRVLGVLGKRLHRYGLTLHPEKTRFVDFRFDRSDGSPPETEGTSFAMVTDWCRPTGIGRSKISTNEAVDELKLAKGQAAIALTKASDVLVAIGD